MVGGNGSRPGRGIQRHAGLERVLRRLREHAGAHIRSGAMDPGGRRTGEPTVAGGAEYVLRIAHATMKVYDIVMRNDCYSNLDTQHGIFPSRYDSSR